MYRFRFPRKRRRLLSASSLVLLAASGAPVLAQQADTTPPPTTGAATQPSASPRAESSPTPQDATPAPTAEQQGAGNVLPTTRVAAPAQKPRTPKPPTTSAVTNPSPAPTEQQVVAQQNEKFDAARQNIFPSIGAGSYEVSHQAIEALPQGNNAPLDKALLQFPGVTQDSAASGELHVRNEHANLQYRINGVMLPDGVGAFGQILDTGIVGTMALLTGALPAQYGLRTAGVLDIQTKADAFDNSGKISVYGGSHQNITPFGEYGGTVGQTQYYVSGRYFYSNLGIENPTPANEAIHDRTQQELALAVVDLSLGLLADLPRQPQHLDPIGEHRRHPVEPPLDIYRLQDLLLLGRGDIHEARNQISECRRGSDRLHRIDELARDLRQQL